MPIVWLVLHSHHEGTDVYDLWQAQHPTEDQIAECCQREHLDETYAIIGPLSPPTIN
jgi:hypothetical protein